MNFPSAGQVVLIYNFLLISGPLALTVGMVFLVRGIRARRNPSAECRRPGPSSQIVGGLIAILIGLVHFVGIYVSVWNAVRFRFDPKDVTELRIVRMVSEGDQGASLSRTITDRGLIADGLQRLPKSECWWRNHEHLEDGYRIQIVIPGSPQEHDRYLSVYRRSSRDAAVAVVIPHLGKGHGGTMGHAGTYSSPAFHDWVARTIDPLFNSR